MNYYNDNDPKSAAWLRELIAAGLIPAGDVDERSICDVQPEDVRGYTQCHWFAGIGGWSYALRLAGWPEECPVWTGSCPCQPFSVGATNRTQGTGDKRDLWPHFFALIKTVKPTTVFGEQVKNAISWGWWDRTKMDCESEVYSTASAVLRASTYGACHERKRFYWVAYSGSKGWQGCKPKQCIFKPTQKTFSVDGNPLIRSRSALDSDWKDLLSCDGVSVGLVRCSCKGFGNAIVPQVAAEFIKAFLDINP